MSEIQKLQTPQNQEVSRFAEIQARAGEVAQLAIINAQVAVQGLRNLITEKRYDSAVDTMERMDHKDALYQHIGITALGIESPELFDKIGRPLGTMMLPTTESDVVHRDRDGKNPQARTIIERTVDKKVDKKVQKLSRARNEEFLTRTIYGGKSHAGYESNRSQKKRMRAVRKQGKKDGLSAAKIRENVSKSRLEENRPETSMQTQTKRELAKQTKYVERAINQPLLSRWRNERRERAKGRIKQNYIRKSHNKEKTQILSGEKRALEIERELKKSDRGRQILDEQYGRR